MNELKEKLEEAKQHLIDCVECLSQMEELFETAGGELPEDDDGAEDPPP